MRSLGSQLNDLEGLSIDESGFIYAITSHSKNKDGERVPAREQLLRFRIEGSRVADISCYKTLTNDLKASRSLVEAIEEETKEEFELNKLNIEGLAYYRKADQLMLGLNGEGIRALSYDPVLDSFLIVNEIEDKDGDNISQLWTWSGDIKDKPEEIALPGLINLNNVESIDSIVFRGKPRLLILSDEGNQKKKSAGKYMMLNYEQLSR